MSDQNDKSGPAGMGHAGMGPGGMGSDHSGDGSGFAENLGSMPNFEAFRDIVMKSARDTQSMMESFIEQQPDQLRRTLDPFNLTPAFLKFTGKLIENPAALFEAQAKFSERYLALLDSQMRALKGEEAHPIAEPKRGDKRFKGESWSEAGPFDFIKQAYLLLSEGVLDIVSKADDLDDAERERIRFFTRQFLDAIAPSNFLLTNPEALSATIESGGQNLIKGVQNLMQDMEDGQGLPMVRMVDKSAFEVGGNIALTPGDVVFRNRTFELIQYSPTTEKVHATPLLIFPPWINKYYILDLTEKKSFVRWAVAQGYTVFIVSWVNPDGSYADFAIDDMLRDGYLEAFKAVRDITGEKAFHTIGYCVAGTMLASVMAYLEAKGEADQIKTATFFTAQVDFSQAGDLSLFVCDDQLESMDKQMAEKGYLDKRNMALTFNMLRSNDLIWSYVVNNYLLGKDPMAFDLLYWNCDSTNLPRRLHIDYLTNMYRHNRLVEPGAFSLDGVPIDLSKIQTPIYLQAGRDDHIAPAKSVYKMTEHVSGPIRFMLAGSGHIAGVVNPPSAKKYQHWTGPEDATSFDDFVARATEHPGSWWDDWNAWLAPQSGGDVKARIPGSKKAYPSLCPAPGTYVKMTGDPAAE